MRDLFNLYVSEHFFDESTCEDLISELSQAKADAAPVYGRGNGGGAVDVNMRRVLRVTPSIKTVERVTQRLLDQRDAIAAQFSLAISGCEEPQFLRYQVGDFFVAHQDGGTGLIRSESDQWRKVSVSIFLNRQTETPEATGYCGGSLVFTEWRPNRKNGRYEMPADAGTFVAFPSDTTHEVTPVTHGIRYSIVTWYG